MKVGEIILDIQSRTVARASEEIKLEPKEFNLLVFLMRHPSQVFSPEALVQHVWESQTDVSVDSVRVYIRMLRKKLDTPGKPSIIETVHGSGYKLVGDN